MNLTFTRREVEDIAAYISTLAKWDSPLCLLKLVQQAPVVESYAARFLLAMVSPSNAC
jgi:hypothetical protein